MYATKMTRTATLSPQEPHAGGPAARDQKPPTVNTENKRNATQNKATIKLNSL